MVGTGKVEQVEAARENSDVVEERSDQLVVHEMLSAFLFLAKDILFRIP